MKNIAKWVVIASMIAGAAYLIARWGRCKKLDKPGCDNTVLTPEMVDEMTYDEGEVEDE